jgi:hypothetical protein
MKVAKAAKIAVEVDFSWQDQATAAFPGRHGRFAYDALFLVAPPSCLLGLDFSGLHLHVVAIRWR